MGFSVEDDNKNAGNDLYSELLDFCFMNLGTCNGPIHTGMKWMETSTSRYIPNAIRDPERYKFNNYRNITDSNGEVCSLKAFVLVRNPFHPEGPPLIGKIGEILQVAKSTAEKNGSANYVLIEEFCIIGIAEPYQFPHLQSSGWRLVEAMVSQRY